MSKCLKKLIWSTHIPPSGLVFEFQSAGSAIKDILNSTVVDIVALCCLNGEFILLNIKTGTIVMKLQHPEEIISASFRTG